jgi:hypothetical protein
MTASALPFRPAFLALAGLLFGAPGLLGAEDRPTLAVMVLQGAFQAPQGQLPAQRQALRKGRPEAAAAKASARPLGERLIQRIDMAYLQTGRFRLIERTQLAAVLKEAAFEQNGLVDEATAVTLGRQLGATYVLVGSYSGALAHAAEVQEHLFGKDTRVDFYPAKLEVRLRLVRTEDGTIQEPILLTATAKAPQASAAFELLMEDFTRALEHELALRYPLNGYVVRVLSGQELLCDLGREQGVREGDVFTLLATGEEAIHPVTGKPVPGERKVLGELLVTDAGPGSSTLRVTSGRPVLKPGALLQRKAR